MKQLQALKTSVELKSQAVLAREKELAEAEQQSMLDEADEDTLGGETQTTAGETAATSVVPLAPPDEMEEDEALRLEPRGEGNSSPEQEEGTSTPKTDAPLASSQEKGPSAGEAPPEGTDHTADEEYEEVEEEEVEEEEEVVEEEEEEEGHDEDVEIIEETEVVEGDTEGVDIEDVEEYVEVFDDDDTDEVDETVRDDSVGDRNEGVSPKVTDEKEYDEFAWGHHPVMMEKTRVLDETGDEAPMDELEYLRKQSVGETPFDEEERLQSEPHPVFQVLDEEVGEEEETKPQVTFAEPKRAPLEQAVTTQSTAVATRDIEAGDVTSRDTREEEFPPRVDEDGKRRWQFIIACLLVVGACAIAALILPFVLDYDNNDRDISNVTPAPTISPVPTMAPSSSPSMLPTLSPAPSQIPSGLPSTSPTLSKSPTLPPTPNPTRSPTVPPTPAPTRAPVVATPAPVSPTNAPVSPTIAPITPTSRPVAPSTLAPTTLRLGNLIEVFLIPLSGEEVFTNQSSPQFQAAQFIADVDEYATELADETRLAERYALTVFYYATGGENWNQCSRGDTSCAGPWLTGDVCSWQYVACNELSRVTSVNFDGTTSVGLTGFIPPEISVLGVLEVLGIANESVGGSLPETLAVLGATLQFLRLQNNAFSGTVPTIYGSLINLSAMNLQGNGLVGSIPTEICALRTTSLQELTADCNELSCSCCTACFR